MVSMTNNWKLAALNHESEAIGPATDRWHIRKNRGHHGPPAVDRVVRRDVKVEKLIGNQWDRGATDRCHFSRHDGLLIGCGGGGLVVVRRALADEGIQDASGVRENAAGRRDERRSRSTPRTNRGRAGAKRRSPSGA